MLTLEQLGHIRATAARWDVDHDLQPSHCTTCGVELNAVEQYAGDTGCELHRWRYTRRPA
jgi:predicted Zn-ribbon and HTH transcriptional regulator